MQRGMVYLVRHGQAGKRTKYDELSALGREQARQLGRYLANAGLQFAFVVSGELERQKETANIVATELGAKDVSGDSRWNEFDLDEVYRGIGPQLARDDGQFAVEYAALLAEAEKEDSHVHRQWTPCDVAVFRNWCEGTYPFEGESFAQFRGRVRAAAESLKEMPKPAVVFTSATPIGLTMGEASGLSEMDGMQFAGKMWNAAWTEMETEDAGLRVVSFNNVPHLEDRGLLTKR